MILAAKTVKTNDGQECGRIVDDRQQLGVDPYNNRDDDIHFDEFLCN